MKGVYLTSYLELTKIRTNTPPLAERQDREIIDVTHGALDDGAMSEHGTVQGHRAAAKVCLWLTSQKIRLPL